MTSTIASAGNQTVLGDWKPDRSRPSAQPEELPRDTRSDRSTARRVSLTRRGRVVLVVVLLALALAAFTMVGDPAASTAAPHHANSPTVVVQPGQTLWDIAAEAAPASDPRDVVAEIVELNHLTSPGTIRAGQPLYVPAG
jgi:LysM repeat protein